MTQPMLRTLLRLVLRRLARLSPATLTREIPWLTPELVQWALENVKHLAWDDAEYRETKRLIQDAAAVLRKEKF